jgi:hypothetical protein
MLIEERNIDIFENNVFDITKEWYLVHCISADCVLGQGIAYDFDWRFNLKNRLLNIPLNNRTHPTCILIDRVFNLITKDLYYNKPTYTSLTTSLIKLKCMLELMDIKHIAMPKIGCGLDRLRWDKVRNIIESIFSDTKIHIIVCYI